MEKNIERSVFSQKKKTSKKIPRRHKEGHNMSEATATGSPV